MFKKLFEKLKGKNKGEEVTIEAEQQEEGIEEELGLSEEQENLHDELESTLDLEEQLEESIEIDKVKVDLEIQEIPQDIQKDLEQRIEKITEENPLKEEKNIENIEGETHKETFKDTEVVQEEIVEEPKEGLKEKLNLFKRLKEGLSKTKQGITGKIENLVKSYQKIDEELFEELEEILITADIGVQTTMEIVEDLRNRVREKKITEPNDVKELLKEKLVEMLDALPDANITIEPSPAIILVVGVNGVGKTTSIGKMAHRFKNEGKKVLLAAGDTFRAAAIDQLVVWGDRVGVDVIKHQEGSDPAAIVFDAIQAAKARKIDVLICDTAGRLHNKKNLMNELGKVFRVVEREYPEATREVLLVLDATTGQNAVQQAKTFKEVASISGLILTKLDGTAKGGVVIGISRELNIPVKLIGVGEKMEDLQQFEPKTFVQALFGDE